MTIPLEPSQLEVKVYTEADLAKLDYEKPILLKQEYQEFQVKGNFDLQTAEKILRRQLGIIRKVRPEEFERIERCLNYIPTKEDYNIEKSPLCMASTIITAKPFHRFEECHPWIYFSVMNKYERLNENPLLSVKAGYSRQPELSPLLKPFNKSILGISGTIVSLRESEHEHCFYLKAMVFHPEHYLDIETKILLEVPFLKELLSY